MASVNACNALPTPIGDGMVTLRLGVSGSLEPLESMPWGLRRLPRRLVAAVLSQFTMLGLYHDVVQDRRIWVTKRHVPFRFWWMGTDPSASTATGLRNSST